MSPSVRKKKLKYPPRSANTAPKLFTRVTLMLAELLHTLHPKEGCFSASGTEHKPVNSKTAPGGLRSRIEKRSITSPESEKARAQCFCHRERSALRDANVGTSADDTSATANWPRRPSS